MVPYMGISKTHKFLKCVCVSLNNLFVHPPARLPARQANRACITDKLQSCVALLQAATPLRCARVLGVAFRLFGSFIAGPNA